MDGVTVRVAVDPDRAGDDHRHHFRLLVFDRQILSLREGDKFADIGWRAGAAGTPIIEDGLADFVCARHRLVDAGDHLVLIGRVIDHQAREGRPLGYFRGGSFSLGLEAPLVADAAHRGALAIGVVAASGGRVLLESDENGVRAPAAPHADVSLEGVARRLRALGLRVEMGALYAVYRDSATGRHVIYYHGEADGPAPPGFAYFDVADIPLDRVANTAERSMLARYRDEHRHGAFGVYHGDETEGVVIPAASHISNDPAPKDLTEEN